MTKHHFICSQSEPAPENKTETKESEEAPSEEPAPKPKGPKKPAGAVSMFGGVNPFAAKKSMSMDVQPDEDGDKEEERKGAKSLPSTPASEKVIVIILLYNTT